MAKEGSNYNMEVNKVKINLQYLDFYLGGTLL